MQTKKWYSPQLERYVVHLLYLEAKSRRVPMTRLANEFIVAALRGGKIARRPEGSRYRRRRRLRR